MTRLSKCTFGIRLVRRDLVPFHKVTTGTRMVAQLYMTSPAYKVSEFQNDKLYNTLVSTTKLSNHPLSKLIKILTRILRIANTCPLSQKLILKRNHTTLILDKMEDNLFQTSFQLGLNQICVTQMGESLTRGR